MTGRDETNDVASETDDDRESVVELRCVFWFSFVSGSVDRQNHPIADRVTIPITVQAIFLLI